MAANHYESEIESPMCSVFYKSDTLILSFFFFNSKQRSLPCLHSNKFNYVTDNNSSSQ